MFKIPILLLFAIYLCFCLSACKTNDTETTIKNNDISSDIISSEPMIEIPNVRENCTFRDTIWGDDLEQVKNIEEAIFVDETEESIVYEGSICGYKSLITYKFNQNKLYEGGYYISDIYTSAGQYISAYETIKKQLYEKYGSSTEDDIIELEEDSLIEMAGESRALKYGYVVYRARWETSNTNIVLGMMAENYDVYIVLSYKDKNHVENGNSDGI